MRLYDEFHAKNETSHCNYEIAKTPFQPASVDEGAKTNTDKNAYDRNSRETKQKGPINGFLHSVPKKETEQ